MRTGTNDKALIHEECYKAQQQITDLRALVSFALFQVEHAEPEEFFRLQGAWEAMLRMIKEKLDIVGESTNEAAYLAITSVPVEETQH